MVFFFAFLTLGILVGTLAAFTAESVVSSLLPLLFAFVGGSAIAFFQKLERQTIELAAIAILAMSIGCLAGVYSGVYVFEHKLLTPVSGRDSRATAEGYLRSKDIDAIYLVDQQKRTGALSSEEAYKELFDIIEKKVQR